MSEVVKDPTSDKKISFNLIGLRNRHFNLAPADKFFKTTTVTDLEFNYTDFPAKVAAMNAAEGIKIHKVSILDAAYEKLKKHNTHYLDIIIGKVEFGTYDASVKTNFLMNVASEKLPDMITHADILEVSAVVKSGNLALIALGLTPPLDFTAAENNLLKLDVDTKINDLNVADDIYTTAKNVVATRKGICKTLCTVARKEVQFHVNDKSEAEMRVYARTFTIVFALEKPETEVDILALYADGTGIVTGLDLRIGKLFTNENKVKKIEAVLGVKGTTNAHGEDILFTTQVGDLYVIWEKDGVVKGSAPIHLIAGEDMSITIHIVKAPPEV